MIKTLMSGIVYFDYHKHCEHNIYPSFSTYNAHFIGYFLQTGCVLYTDRILHRPTDSEENFTISRPKLLGAHYNWEGNMPYIYVGIDGKPEFARFFN